MVINYANHKNCLKKRTSKIAQIETKYRVWAIFSFCVALPLVPPKVFVPSSYIDLCSKSNCEIIHPIIVYMYLRVKACYLYLPGCIAEGISSVLTCLSLPRFKSHQSRSRSLTLNIAHLLVH